MDDLCKRLTNIANKVQAQHAKALDLYLAYQSEWKQGIIKTFDLRDELISALVRSTITSIDEMDILLSMIIEMVEQSDE